LFTIYGKKWGNIDQAIAHYCTQLDLSWVRDPYPIPVIRGVVATTDHDLVPQELSVLRNKYKAVAADWESGAIAYVSAHNKVPCLILRGVTVVVGPHGNPAYDNPNLYFKNARKLMARLILSLPQWLARA
jgi:adenosylhomocysteine nucleosidase